MTSPAEHAATVRSALVLAGLTYAEPALDTLQAQAEAAQREADIQMGAKLAAQMTLKAVCDVLNLPMVSLGNGWTEATPKILARIETIVDEADRGFRERDAAEAEREQLTAERDAHERDAVRLRAERGRLAARVADLEAALRAYFAEADGWGENGVYAPSDATEALMRAALAADKEQA